VHAANILVRNPQGDANSGLDLEYLAAVGATSGLQQWRELARELLTEDRS
jgi:hypothetical protein